MRPAPYIFLTFFLIISLAAFAQQTVLEKRDTTIPVFWDRSLHVRLQIGDPDEPNPEKNNAVLQVLRRLQGAERIIFRDSLFAFMIGVKMMDVNGDGIHDLLIYHSNNGPENKSFHLYLVNQEQGLLTKVKGFEKVLNPYYDPYRCRLLGAQLLGRKMVMRLYHISRNGILGMTNWSE